ncbi:olfactory receptor 5B2-like [Anguilla anguilla]|uniref:olfactory receptor 5B2-like n=1 Tax=Anguilla anguilla TaxID=7936 RepID=UPI0015AF0725|nr:olfactory receptor 5B2-like [Anguilla anguilla]
MAILATSITNDSIIRPAGFYVIGFRDLKFADLYLIFLGFIYIVTAVCNSFLISVIWIDRCLHTPKYIAVANLGVVDLILSTSFIPSAINTFVTKDTFMSFNACLTQMFFYSGSAILESLSLIALAYDRLIAICFPLRHNSLNTPTSMISILAIAWSYSVGIMVFGVLSLTKLSFCDSLTVYSFFCDYVAVFALACNDSTLQWTTAASLSSMIGFGALSFILMSYTCILAAVFRMKNVESRYKALATCTEHLVLVAIYYGPIMTLYVVELFLFRVDPTVRLMSVSFASCVPPCLNPIVYSLSTKEIRNRLLAILHKVKEVTWEGQTETQRLR